MDPDAASAWPFPAATRQALDLDRVLAWMAKYARTPAGRRFLLQANPALPPEQREQRTRAGREWAAALEEEDAPPLGPCVDLAAFFEGGRQRVLEGADLASLADTLGVLRELRAWGAARREKRPALAACCARLPDTGSLEEEIRRTVDPRGRVRKEADPGLARVRAEVERLGRERDRAVEEAAEDWARQGLLRQRRPVVRGSRVVLAVRSSHQGRARGIVHARSQSGDTVFVEPERVVAAANALAAAEDRERRLVHRILAAWTARLAAAAPGILPAEEPLGLLDGLGAAALWARETGACWAEIAAEPLLDLRAARHPLLLRSLGPEAVVPLDLQLGLDFDLLVVTGPNTGGKTVVLKTAGLLAALACAGLPLPVEEGSRVGRLQGLDADIGDAQSLESSLSTFSGHLQRILRILETCPAGSLVLLDELGTGTDPEEGAALGQALLETLLARGCRVLASTHLGALKLFSTTVPRAENASMEFDPASLEPRFRLLVGVPGASHALEVAERLGLPAPVLERARRLVRADAGAERLLAEVARVRRDAELLRERARDREQEIRQRARQLEEEQEESRRRGEMRQREAEEAFQELQAGLLETLEQGLAGLRDRLGPRERQDLEALAAALRRLLQENPLGRRWREFLRSLEPGSRVFVPRYREHLTVLKVDRRRERVRLRHGQLEITLPMREISWSSLPPGTAASP